MEGPSAGCAIPVPMPGRPCPPHFPSPRGLFCHKTPPSRGWKDPVHPATPSAEPHPTPVAQRGIDPAAGASVPQAGPGDPSVDLLPTQRKALAVPVVLGGPGQGHGFREVFWNAAQESEGPFWGAYEVPCPEFKNLWGTLRFPLPHLAGLGPPTNPRAGWGCSDPAEPPQARKRVGPPDITSSSAHCAASPLGKKGGSRPTLGLAAGLCLPTKASRPHPPNASSSGKGRGRAFLEPN